MNQEVINLRKGWGQESDLKEKKILITHITTSNNYYNQMVKSLETTWHLHTS